MSICCLISILKSEPAKLMIEREASFCGGVLANLAVFLVMALMPKRGPCPQEQTDVIYMRKFTRLAETRLAQNTFNDNNIT